MITKRGMITALSLLFTGTSFLTAVGYNAFYRASWDLWDCSWSMQARNSTL